MKAVVLSEYGSHDVLEIRDVPDPRPGRFEVWIRVEATALNRADLLQRRGRYPPPDPKPEIEIPGLEFAGTVDFVGADVTSWKVGDRACGLLNGGGYAEQVVTHERLLMRIPTNLSTLEAAAVPEVFLTAYDALTEQADLTTGEVLLVHAGSGLGFFPERR